MEIHEFAKVTSVSSLYLAANLAEREKDEARKKKKRRIVDKKRTQVLQAFPDISYSSLDDPINHYTDVFLRKSLYVNLEREEKLKLLIDLSLSDPFAPYEVFCEKGDVTLGLKDVAGLLSIDYSAVDQLLKTRDEAISSHYKWDWTSIALWGVGGMLVLGLGGWMFAPVIGAALGTAAGLSGAAATAHGLALLGGGSLALGGSGMAGGVWLITATAVTVGGTTMGGGAFLLQLGAAQAKVELIKMQVSFKEILMANQAGISKAQAAIKNLTVDLEEAKKALAESKELNDSNARCLKDMELTVKAMEEALVWMEAEKKKHAA